MLPERFRNIIMLNPMVHFINAYRDIFYNKTSPSIASLSIIFGISLIMLFIGYNVFKKLEKGFAEEV